MAANNPSLPLLGTPDEGLLPGEGLLLYAIADLMRNGNLQRRFLANPQEVMDWYRLPANARATLFSMRADLIGSFISNEFQANGQILGTVPAWPGPNPHIDDIKPNRAAAKATVSVTVTGEGLLDGADVLLVPPGGGAPLAAPAKAEAGAGPDFRHLALTATFTLPAAPKGDYDVRVRNSSNVDDVVVAPNNKKFTVT
jgi:hypothetical protein